MPHDEFWQVSLREYDLITTAHCKGKDRDFRAKRVLNQELGVLVQFAFNDPKKMPDFTKAISEKKEKVIGGKMGAAYLRLYLTRLSRDS